MPWNRDSRWLVAILTGLFAAAVVVGVLQIVNLELLWSLSWPTLKVFLPAILALALLGLVRFSSPLWREIDHWAARPALPLDACLLATVAALLVAANWPTAARAYSSGPPATAIIACMVGLPLLARVTLTASRKLRRTPQTASNAKEGDLLDEVVGSNGMEPLPDLDADDALERIPFVDTLEAAVRHRREHSFTFGLNGPWGSGKTTILNALQKRLVAHNAVVVRFDAWSFREPERVINNYLTQVSKALRLAGGSPGLGAQLRRLGLGIAPLAGSRVADTVRAWLADSAESVGDLLQELRRALHSQQRLVVIIVDDLDRLERDELHATLRMLRLLGDLPGVSHVLAYDRRQLSHVLFPEDATMRLARDSLAKIVHVELSLPTPSPAASSRLLDAVLAPLIGMVGGSEAQRFVERLNSLPRKTFLEAIPTPREIRRVAAATALQWPRLQRDLNLFDLFVLQLVHARFPLVFDAVQAHPEWFTEQEWSGDPWGLAEGERWKKESEEYVKGLWESDDVDQVAAARLLALIFPSVARAPGRMSVSEPTARKDRRICHPSVFVRYFQLSVPREAVAESSIEDLAERLRAAAPPTRAALMQQTMQEAAQRDGASSLLDQWDLFLDSLAIKDDPQAREIVRDLALGFARAGNAFTGDYNDPFNPRRRAARPLLQLIGRAGSNQDISWLACEVIRECPSFTIAGLIVVYTTTPDLSQRAFPNRSLDEQRIHGEFDQKVRLQLSTSPSPLFELSDDDLGSVVYRTGQPHLASEVVVRALHENPGQLPRLLGFAVKLGVNGDDPESVSVFHDGLADLQEQIDLATILRMTERLQPEYWEDPHERALVLHFRRRCDEVVAGAARAKTEAERKRAAPPPESGNPKEV